MSQFDFDIYGFVDSVCSNKKILNKTTLFEVAYDLMVERKQLKPHSSEVSRETKRRTFTGKYSKKELSNADKAALRDAAFKLLNETASLLNSVPSEGVALAFESQKPVVTLSKEELEELRNCIALRETALKLDLKEMPWKPFSVLQSIQEKITGIKPQP